MNNQQFKTSERGAINIWIGAAVFMFFVSAAFVGAYGTWMNAKAANANTAESAMKADTGNEDCCCIGTVPSCTISATPDSVAPGATVTLKLSTKHASSAFINHGIGLVGIHSQTKVHPDADVTYVAVVSGFGGLQETCKVQVTVGKPVEQPKPTPKPTPTPAPSCKLSASDTSIKAGQEIKLTLNSNNASSASINQGVGSVKADDVVKVSPKEDTTYTAHVKGNGGDDDCSVKINVEKEQPKPTPTPTPKPTPAPQATCPIAPKAGRVIYPLTTSSIHSDERAPHVAGPFGVSIDPGTYKVILGSWDDHVSNPNEKPQVKEQWYVDFGSFNSGTISDLPEKQDTLVQEVNSTLKITSHISQVSAVHAFYPDMSSANSIHPTCFALEKVEQPVEQPKTPSCTLAAQPASIKKGEQTTLRLDSTNATKATINTIGTVATDADVKVSPNADTTYTATVTGAEGKTATCTTKVDVKEIPVVVKPAASCTLDASALTIQKGQSTTLNWTSQHATGTSIDTGVGSVGTSGSKTVSPSGTTTYTASFVGEDGKTVTCAKTITVVTPTASYCTLSVNTSSVVSGSNTSVTLSWYGVNVSNGTIDHGVGSVGTTGQTTVTPNGDTTYTANFWNPTNGNVTCSAHVGVTNPPVATSTVTIITNNYPTPTSQPLSYVYLSQVPYTGVADDAVVATLMWLAIIAFAGSITYYLTVKGPLKGSARFIARTLIG